MKYFTNVKTLEELKKEYHKLVMKYHPDLGGDCATMQVINDEYDRLFKTLKNIHIASDGRTYTAQTTEAPNDFKDLISELIKMRGVKIEIIGSWLWLTGNTYKHKEQIKVLGFEWSKSKKAWYYHKGSYSKLSRKAFSLNDIREMYGTQEITLRSVASIC